MRRVAVVIESISAEAVAASVDSLGIRIKTELRLRELGLVVRNQTDTAQTDGYLYFNAVLVPTYDKTMWVINLSLSVEQPVVLRRNSRISVVASTWEARSRGRLVPTASLLPEISRMLTDMLEEFSNAWLSANPRR